MCCRQLCGLQSGGVFWERSGFVVVVVVVCLEEVEEEEEEDLRSEL